jgi:uncharacterized protein DUF5658
MTRCLSLGCLVLFATVSIAGAQSLSPEPRPSSLHPSDVDLLVACQAVLHAADMFTTAYDLSLGGTRREANPILKPLMHHPVTLTVASSAIDVLQAYTVTRLQRNHPKLARWWALALVATETWATINNVNAAGELQRQRSAQGR